MNILLQTEVDSKYIIISKTDWGRKLPNAMSTGQIVICMFIGTFHFKLPIHGLHSLDNFVAHYTFGIRHARTLKSDQLKVEDADLAWWQCSFDSFIFNFYCYVINSELILGSHFRLFKYQFARNYFLVRRRYFFTDFPINTIAQVYFGEMFRS